MNRTTRVGAAIAAAAVGVIAVAFMLRPQQTLAPVPAGSRDHRDLAPASESAAAPGEDPVRVQHETVRSAPLAGPQGAGMSPERWGEVQEILAAVTGEETRRRDVLEAFLQMVGRVRDIEKARVRYRVEPEKTVIEIPAFREEGRAIHAEWLKASLAALTPEEGARFTRSPEFDSGRLSPELDLLRAANLFSGSRYGKGMEPDLLWDETTRVDAQRIVGGKVQVRVGTPERTGFSEFENQQEALNHLNREFGHLLGPVPQLFR